MTDSPKRRQPYDVAPTGTLLALAAAHRDGAHVQPDPECPRCRTEQVLARAEKLDRPPEIVD